MESSNIKTRFFIPFRFNIGRECFKSYILCFSLLALSGCLTTGESDPLAPSPPVAARLSSEQQNQITYQPYYFTALGNTHVDVDLVHMASADKGRAFDGALGGEDVGALASVHYPNKTPSVSKKCRFKDRFDRKALLAYEWSRSRLALDVDGINLDSGSDRAVMLEYKLKFQPEKTKKQRCRFTSSWQGLIGSGYNELFMREEDTVWGELKDMKKDALQYIDRVF